MKLFAKYLKPFVPKMILGLIIKVGATMSELLLPMILSHVLKVVVARQDIYAILRWGGIMILCAAAALIMHITANRIATRVSCSFSQDVRHDLFRRILTLSAAQTDQFTIPSLESRITTDTYNLHQFVGMVQRMGIRAPIMLVGGVLVAGFMDLHMAMIMVVIMPVLLAIILFVSSAVALLLIFMQL